MMTLRNLFEVMWTVTELEISAYDDNHLVHKWIYGPEALKKETRHQYQERMDGLLTIVEEKINAHGDPARGGTEIGWGVKLNLIPKAILDAPITHLGVMNHHSGENRVYANIELPELTAMTLIPQEENNDH